MLQHLGCVCLARRLKILPEINHHFIYLFFFRGAVTNKYFDLLVSAENVEK